MDCVIIPEQNTHSETHGHGVSVSTNSPQWSADMRKGSRILFWLALLPVWRAEPVVINEIMYNPAGGGEALEYIELYNEEIVPFDLGGWHFADGIEFTFPEGTFMAPHSYIVLCNDVSAMRAAYAISNLTGVIRSPGR